MVVAPNFTNAIRVTWYLDLLSHVVVCRTPPCEQEPIILLHYKQVKRSNVKTEVTRQKVLLFVNATANRVV